MVKKKTKQKTVKDKNLPVEKYSIGNVQASVFEHDTEYGKRHNIALQVSYPKKDEDGVVKEWIKSIDGNLNLRDAEKVIRVLTAIMDNMIESSEPKSEAE